LQELTVVLRQTIVLHHQACSDMCCSLNKQGKNKILNQKVALWWIQGNQKSLNSNNQID